VRKLAVFCSDQWLVWSFQTDSRTTNKILNKLDSGIWWWWQGASPESPIQYKQDEES